MKTPLPKIDNLSPSQLIELQKEILARLSPEQILDKLPKEFREELQSCFNEVTDEDYSFFTVKAEVNSKVWISVNTESWDVEAGPDTDELDWDYDDIEYAVKNDKDVAAFIKERKASIKKLRSKIAKACKLLNITERQLVKLL